MGEVDILSQQRRNTMRSAPDAGSFTILMKSEVKRDLREIEAELSGVPEARPEAMIRISQEPPAISAFLTLASKRRRWRKWEREPQAMARDVKSRRDMNEVTRLELGSAIETVASAQRRFTAVRSTLVARLSLLRRQRATVEAGIDEAKEQLGDISNAVVELIDLGDDERKVRLMVDATSFVEELEEPTRKNKRPLSDDDCSLDFGKLGDEELLACWERLSATAAQGLLSNASLAGVLSVEENDNDPEVCEDNTEEASDDENTRSLRHARLLQRDDALFGDLNSVKAILDGKEGLLMTQYVLSDSEKQGAYVIVGALQSQGESLAQCRDTEKQKVESLRERVREKEAKILAANIEFEAALSTATRDRQLATANALKCAELRQENSRLKKRLLQENDEPPVPVLSSRALSSPTPPSNDEPQLSTTFEQPKNEQPKKQQRRSPPRTAPAKAKTTKKDSTGKTKPK